MGSIKPILQNCSAFHVAQRKAILIFWEVPLFFMSRSVSCHFLAVSLSLGDIKCDMFAEHSSRKQRFTARHKCALFRRKALRQQKRYLFFIPWSIALYVHRVCWKKQNVGAGLIICGQRIFTTLYFFNFTLPPLPSLPSLPPLFF